MTDTTELVVLCDIHGTPTGTAPKATVHTAETPLHLAFSCYVLDLEGRLLLTRRAFGKATWPGIWTNSFCGHPGPGEATGAALMRRASQELGLPNDALFDVQPALPDYSYRAVDASGVVEWEICPVFVARLRDPALLNPQPEEIEEFEWVSVSEAVERARTQPEALSPWMVEQLTDPRLLELLS